MQLEEALSRLMLIGLVAALVASTLVTWHTMVVEQDYAVFVAEEDVPEPTDLIVRVAELWTR